MIREQGVAIIKFKRGDKEQESRSFVILFGSISREFGRCHKPEIAPY